MTPTQLRKAVKTWADCIRPQAAIAKMIQANISPRAAEQMANGTYKHRIRPSTLIKLKNAGAIE